VAGVLVVIVGARVAGVDDVGAKVFDGGWFHIPMLMGDAGAAGAAEAAPSTAGGCSQRHGSAEASPSIYCYRATSSLLVSSKWRAQL
jgi:hypothetical protein